MEQILLKCKACLCGMDFFEWYIWQEAAWSCWWISVGLTIRSVSNQLSSLFYLSIYKINLFPRVFWSKLDARMIGIKNIQEIFQFSSPCCHNKNISSVHLHQTSDLSLFVSYLKGIQVLHIALLRKVKWNAKC